MDQHLTDAVFTAAATATAWIRTDLGLRTEVVHAGYTWTVELPASRQGVARIAGRDGYGGTEFLDVPASPGQTIGIVDAACTALRPTPQPAGDSAGPVFRLQRWDALDDVWEDRGVFKGGRGQINADFAVDAERALGSGPLRLFRDGVLLFADDPAAWLADAA